MKKSLFFIAAGALALSACTSEAVIDDAAQKQNVIGFENVVKKHTLAEETTTSNIQKFYVYSKYVKGTAVVDVFNNTEVARSGGEWAYAGERQYWIPDGVYDFYAYSNGNNKIETGVSLAYTGTTPEFTIAGYQLDQSDLIYAYAQQTGKEKDNADVALTFNHLLSRVNAQFTSGFPKDYQVVISDIAIKDANNTGDYSSTDGWKNQARSAASGEVTSVDLPAADTSISVTKGDKAVATKTAYVIPCTYEDETPNVYISFKINITYNGVELLEKVLNGYFNPIWQAGHSYTYNIEVNGDAANLGVVSFTTEVDENGNIVTGEWKPGEGEITFDFRDENE